MPRSRQYKSRQYRARAQRGQAIIELIASIIMFVVMLALIFTISAYLYVQHAFVSAAREGARNASLDTALGVTATQVSEEQSVENYTVATVQSLTGITIDTGNVTVVPPDPAGVTGDRTVTVQINYNMQNPLPIAAFLQALGASGEGLDVIPVAATATMRYEE